MNYEEIKEIFSQLSVNELRDMYEEKVTEELRRRNIEVLNIKVHTGGEGMRLSTEAQMFGDYSPYDLEYIYKGVGYKFEGLDVSQNITWFMYINDPIDIDAFRETIAEESQKYRDLLERYRTGEILPITYSSYMTEKEVSREKEIEREVFEILCEVRDEFKKLSTYEDMLRRYR